MKPECECVVIKKSDLENAFRKRVITAYELFLLTDLLQKVTKYGAHNGLRS
jgi:hypothetical protein